MFLTLKSYYTSSYLIITFPLSRPFHIISAELKEQFFFKKCAISFYFSTLNYLVKVFKCKASNKITSTWFSFKLFLNFKLFLIRFKYIWFLEFMVLKVTILSSAVKRGLYWDIENPVCEVFRIKLISQNIIRRVDNFDNINIRNNHFAL